MYSGVFRDVYREFMIQVNEEYLGCRGENMCTLVHASACSQTRAQAVTKSPWLSQQDAKMKRQPEGEEKK